MRRIFLRIVVMMLTFVAGAGYHFIIGRFTSTPKPVVVVSPPPLVTASQPLIREPPPLPIAEARDVTNVVADFDFDTYSFDGTYYLMGNPKGFHDFSSFSFFVGEINHDGALGFLQVETKLKNERDYDAASFGLVTEERVFFVVAKTSESGIGYRFDGKFLYRNLDPFDGLQKPVLTGTLTKTKFGRKIAEEVVSFRIEFDNC